MIIRKILMTSMIGGSSVALLSLFTVVAPLSAAASFNEFDGDQPQKLRQRLEAVEKDLTAIKNPPTLAQLKDEERLLGDVGMRARQKRAEANEAQRLANEARRLATSAQEKADRLRNEAGGIQIEIERLRVEEAANSAAMGRAQDQLNRMMDARSPDGISKANGDVKIATANLKKTQEALTQAEAKAEKKGVRAAQEEADRLRAAADQKQQEAQLANNEAETEEATAGAPEQHLTFLRRLRQDRELLDALPELLKRMDSQLRNIGAAGLDLQRFSWGRP